MPQANPGVMLANSKPKIFVVFYSTYGHVKEMAMKIKEGVDAAGGDARLYRVPETLPDEVLQKMNAALPDTSIPEITAHELVNADGILFGMPTRFGMMPAQMKAMWDSTGKLWLEGKLTGKPAACFFATGSLGGGQETTALTMVSQFVHHGMIYVPLGYTSKLLLNTDEVHGGSPYGAGCLAGPMGDRLPSALELELAYHQGVHFTKTATCLKVGMEANVTGKKFDEHSQKA
eukprot:Selendium_serpulae@DN4584_c0_g1_i3.p1